MPWNKNDYPASMKNLQPEVREKAIEIANALLSENYEEGRAIPIAIDRAKMAVDGMEESEKEYHVLPHDEGWQVKEKDNSRASIVANTKEEALKRARELSRSQNGEIVIHKSDGSKQ